MGRGQSGLRGVCSGKSCGQRPRRRRLVDGEGNRRQDRRHVRGGQSTSSVGMLSNPLRDSRAISPVGQVLKQLAKAQIRLRRVVAALRFRRTYVRADDDGRGKILKGSARRRCCPQDGHRLVVRLIARNNDRSVVFIVRPAIGDVDCLPDRHNRSNICQLVFPKDGREVRTRRQR
eukprot:scaffold90_cov264-Pinguiococcus_pyrenoidosus.AAC.3